MAIENIKLRATSNPPLTTKGSELTWAELDANFIAIFNSLFEQYMSSYVPNYDGSTVYDDTDNNYSSYGSKTWKYVFPTPGMAPTPGTDVAYWVSVAVADMGHKKNRDTNLAPDHLLDYLIIKDNGSPQHKWKVRMDATGEFLKEDLGTV